MPIYVKLKQNSRYVAQMSNPKIGSTYKTIGTIITNTHKFITSIKKITHNTVRVSWKNTYANVYSSNELILCDKYGNIMLIDLETAINNKIEPINLEKDLNKKKCI